MAWPPSHHTGQHVTTCGPQKTTSGCGSQEEDYEECRQRCLNGTLAGIVSAFERCDMEYHKRERAHYAAEDTLENRIRKAGRSVGHEGKFCPHQWRIGRARLELVIEQRLLPAAGRLDRAAQQNFTSLHSTVCKVLNGFPRVGQLFYYDFSERFGGFYKTRPQVVYLHCGTRIGAKTLADKGYLKKIQDDTLSISALPQELQRLTAADIESLLCIYCDEIGQLQKIG